MFSDWGRVYEACVVSSVGDVLLSLAGALRVVVHARVAAALVLYEAGGVRCVFVIDGADLSIAYARAGGELLV